MEAIRKEALDIIKTIKLPFDISECLEYSNEEVKEIVQGVLSDLKINTYDDAVETIEEIYEIKDVESFLGKETCMKLWNITVRIKNLE